MSPSRAPRVLSRNLRRQIFAQVNLFGKSIYPIGRQMCNCWNFKCQLEISRSLGQVGALKNKRKKRSTTVNAPERSANLHIYTYIHTYAYVRACMRAYTHTHTSTGVRARNWSPTTRIPSSDSININERRLSVQSCKVGYRAHDLGQRVIPLEAWYTIEHTHRGLIRKNKNERNASSRSDNPLCGLRYSDTRHKRHLSN